MSIAVKNGLAVCISCIVVFQFALCIRKQNSIVISHIGQRILAIFAFTKIFEISIFYSILVIIACHLMNIHIKIIIQQDIHSRTFIHSITRIVAT